MPPASPAALRFLLFALVWLSSLCIAAPAAARTAAAAGLAELAAHPAVTVLRTALAADGAPLGFPTDAATVALPDEWAASRPGFGGTLSYRVRFERPAAVAAGELMALYAPHVCSAFEVRLNGQLVSGGARLAAPITHDCNHPQLIELPAAVFRPGNNVLDIRVAGHRLAEVGSRQRAGALSELWVGPEKLLAPVHARALALAVAAPQGASATLVLMGGFMFVLGFINRRESHLAYFGALCVGSALVDSRLWIRDLPFGHTAAEFLLLSLLGFVAWAAVQFLLRYAGLRMRWVDVALPAQCAAIAFSLMAAGSGGVHVLASFWYAVLSIEVAAAAVLHLRHRAAQGSVRGMAVLLGFVFVGAVAQFAGEWSADAASLSSVEPWLQLVQPAVFLLVGLRLIQQHGRALQHAEIGKAQLEQRVREATAEIERNFRQLSELKVEQVTERERKRIAADLHDDLGAKLLTIVHTSESERISSLAREALEEMRLSVRGLTGKPVLLADALGDWRAEVVARLGQAGIDGEWQAPEELPYLLSSRAYVQTTRILREATSNIIKHSGASAASVKCAIADGDFQLVVQDNGNGISTEVDGRLDRGHGLAGMKNRAKQLQGQCLVESGPGYGTVIRLTLPLDRATGTS